MNVIFLTMTPISDINVREIYPDLLRMFVSKGHKVFVFSSRDFCPKNIEVHPPISDDQYALDKSHIVLNCPNS